MTMAGVVVTCLQDSLQAKSLGLHICRDNLAQRHRAPSDGCQAGANRLSLLISQEQHKANRFSWGSLCSRWRPLARCASPAPAVGRAKPVLSWAFSVRRTNILVHEFLARCGPLTGGIEAEESRKHKCHLAVGFCTKFYFIGWSCCQIILR